MNMLEDILSYHSKTGFNTVEQDRSEMKYSNVFAMADKFHSQFLIFFCWFLGVIIVQ